MFRTPFRCGCLCVCVKDSHATLSWAASARSVATASLYRSQCITALLFFLTIIIVHRAHAHTVSRSPPTPGHTGRQQQALCLNDNPTAAEATAAVAGKGIPKAEAEEERSIYIPPLSHTKVHIVHNVLAKLADGGFDDTARASGLVSKKT